MYYMTRMWLLNLVTFHEWPFVTFRDLSWLAVLGGVDSGLWCGLRTGRRREYKRHRFPLSQPYRCTNIERPVCSHSTAEVPILHWIVSSLLWSGMSSSRVVFDPESLSQIWLDSDGRLSTDDSAGVESVKCLIYISDIRQTLKYKLQHTTRFNWVRWLEFTLPSLLISTLPYLISPYLTLTRYLAMYIR